MPVPGFEKPVLLVGREHMNRAVQGDVVAVEVFDEKDWKAPADEVVDQEGIDARSSHGVCASSNYPVESYPEER